MHLLPILYKKLMEKKEFLFVFWKTTTNPGSPCRLPWTYHSAFLASWPPPQYLDWGFFLVYQKLESHEPDDQQWARHRWLIIKQSSCSSGPEFGSTRLEHHQKNKKTNLLSLYHHTSVCNSKHDITLNETLRVLRFFPLWKSVLCTIGNKSSPFLASWKVCL